MPALPKKELRELITTDRTDEALGQLLDLLAEAPELREAYYALSLLRNQLADASNTFGQGLIEYKEKRMEKARIIKEVLQSLDRLPDDTDSAQIKTGQLTQPFAEIQPDPVPAAPPIVIRSAASATLSAADENAWEFTLEKGTRAAFEKYVARFPQGFYVPEAQARLDGFGADDIAWEFALDDGTKRAMLMYLQKYPTGLHASEARERITAEEQQMEIEAERRRLDPFYDLMVLVKGGAYDMGDTFGDVNIYEIPVHEVVLSDFYIGKYPVTLGQWKSVMGDSPYGISGDDMLPATHVSWDDVQAFIHRLNERMGRILQGQVYRLPTEAEWEYAAREGGKKVRFGNGKNIADPKEINFCGEAKFKKPYSIAGEYRVQTTPVDQFKPNALGLHDMSGNVLEWCADEWHIDYQGAPNDGSIWADGGGYRVCRGGAWNTLPEGCRATSRDMNPAAQGSNYLGFRLARGV